VLIFSIYFKLFWYTLVVIEWWNSRYNFNFGILFSSGIRLRYRFCLDTCFLWSVYKLLLFCHQVDYNKMWLWFSQENRSTCIWHP